ncbi:hypothetical protein [Streptomyces sp. NPDC126514]|uniref:hypothetical protein n=1 Tax=Streptomyces sp. NPDC126514 TaxID=3155210 RepID=UPI003327D699
MSNSHATTHRVKADLQLAGEDGNVTAHLELSRRIITDLLERGRVTLVGSDFSCRTESGSPPKQVRYITLDLT